MGSAFSYLRHSVTEITDIIFEHERELMEMDLSNLESIYIDNDTPAVDTYI